MTCGHCEIFGVPPNVKWNKSTHARRHFTRRRRISRTKCISQIPQGIYFIEKNPPLSTTKVGSFLVEANGYLIKEAVVISSFGSCKPSTPINSNGPKNSPPDCFLHGSFDSRFHRNTKRASSRMLFFIWIITHILIQKCRGAFWCTTRSFWCKTEIFGAF